MQSFGQASVESLNSSSQMVRRSTSHMSSAHRDLEQCRTEEGVASEDKDDEEIITPLKTKHGVKDLKGGKAKQLSQG